MGGQAGSEAGSAEYIDERHQISVRRRQGGKAGLSVHPVTSTIVVEVSDTGVGVPDDNWGRLTEPFVHGESNPYKSQERVGLGLPIVRSLVTLNGGALTIKSEVGVGTTVLVSFPT